MMERVINNTVIKLVEGDIAKQDTEAIVNAANNRLWMGSGVAGAILKSGGPEIEKEAISKGPIRVGQAILTRGGKLKAKYVIHAAAMGDEPVNVSGAAKSTFELAKKNRISSISFPALATGVAGFPIDHCAKIMLGVALEEVKKGIELKEIRFVLWGKENYEIFERILKNFLNEK